MVQIGKTAEITFKENSEYYNFSKKLMNENNLKDFLSLQKFIMTNLKNSQKYSKKVENIKHILETER